MAHPASRSEPGTGRARVRVEVSGLVQGVGFRPQVYALARELALAGRVANTAEGVVAEVEGAPEAVTAFADRVGSLAPALAQVEAVRTTALPPQGGTDFVIVESEHGSGRTLVAPDMATCGECLAEMADPHDLRYRHPFISCTNCGPRFTVVVGLPYDRPRTTMADLPLCPTCAAQYADPGDRRFHAQTVACPHCGPSLLLHRSGARDLAGPAALAGARELLAGGAIVAVKGLGGYHLAVDATDSTAVAALRKRKDRGDKPFAVMAADLATVEAFADISAAERVLLVDPRRPVVLLRRRRLETASGAMAPDGEVAPGHPDIGVMLPYTGLHQLLFGLPGDPPGPRILVMTSGNRSGEPIVTDDAAARDRLADLTDAWLSHDRPIHVPCDDSVVRVAAGAALPVRRSRGYAPLPVASPVSLLPALAVGGDLKNTFAVGRDRYAWLSAHVGDMEDLATAQAFEAATSHLCTLTGVRPEMLVTDRHPGYRSAAWARRQGGGLPVIAVGHHHAHIASVMAENAQLPGEPVLGFAFDGTGYGEDGAAWGGEVLLADYADYTRVAHLRYVPLPGGDAGVRNPCRMALSHLRSAGLEWDPLLPAVAACTEDERSVLGRTLATGAACVPTSSMGRLFDAVSSLAGVCHRIAYEAEAAMRFEGLARSGLVHAGPGYRFSVDPDSAPRQIDPTPVLAAAAQDVRAGEPVELIAARFHLAVADLVVELARRLVAAGAPRTVALSGGVFLNALLTELCTLRLDAAGLMVLRHRRVPPSDAGLALGQLAIAARA